MTLEERTRKEFLKAMKDNARREIRNRIQDLEAMDREVERSNSIEEVTDILRTLKSYP